MNFITKDGTIAPTETNQKYANRMLEFHKKGYYRENLADGELTKVDIFPQYEKYMTGVLLRLLRKKNQKQKISLKN